LLYSDEFIASLKTNPVQGAIEVCRMARGQLIDGGKEWEDSEYAVLTEAYALILELIETNLLPIKVDSFNFVGNMAQDCLNISKYLNVIEEKCIAEASLLHLNSYRSRFKASLGSSFCYEFSQGDIERIQNLINEIRDQITATTKFEENHKQRLLKRLERLQAEVHKKVSDLDRFWGLIGDAGVVFGKFGNDAKPIVDRIREIAEIVWRTQARSEELPSGTTLPMLENKKHDKNSAENC